MKRGFSRERHRRIFPRAPTFKFGPKEELEEEVKSQTLPTEEELMEREERLLNKQFQERLLYNMGFVGEGVLRGLRRTTRAPRKPEQGYDFVVTPLKGKKGGRAVKTKERREKIRRIGLYTGPFHESDKDREERLKPYVSMPDGSHRPMNKDEAAFERKRNPRIKIASNHLYDFIGR